MRWWWKKGLRSVVCYHATSSSASSLSSSSSSSSYYYYTYIYICTYIMSVIGIMMIGTSKLAAVSPDLGLLPSTVPSSSVRQPGFGDATCADLLGRGHERVTPCFDERDNEGSLVSGDGADEMFPVVWSPSAFVPRNHWLEPCVALELARPKFLQGLLDQGNGCKPSEVHPSDFTQYRSYRSIQPRQRNWLGPCSRLGDLRHGWLDDRHRTGLGVVVKWRVATVANLEQRGIAGVGLTCGFNLGILTSWYIPPGPLLASQAEQTRRADHTFNVHISE